MLTKQKCLKMNELQLRVRFLSYFSEIKLHQEIYHNFLGFFLPNIFPKGVNNSVADCSLLEEVSPVASLQNK